MTTLPTDQAERDRLLEALRPQAEAMLAAKEAEHDEQRRAILAQLEQLRAQEGREMPTLRKAAEAARAKLATAETALQTATAEARRSEGERATAGWRFAAATQRLEAELRVLTHPAIEAALGQLAAALVNVPQPSVEERRGKQNPFTLERPLEFIVTPGDGAIEKWLGAAHAARQRLGELVYSTLDGDAIRAEVGAIMATIPAKPDGASFPTTAPDATWTRMQQQAREGEARHRTDHSLAGVRQSEERLGRATQAPRTAAPRALRQAAAIVHRMTARSVEATCASCRSSIRTGEPVHRGSGRALCKSCVRALRR